MVATVPYVHAHIDPEVPHGFFPPEIERWLFDNFLALQSAVRVSSVIADTFTIENTAAEVDVFELVVDKHDLHAGEMVQMQFSGVYSNESSSDDFTVRLYINGALAHAIQRLGGNETDTGLILNYTGTIHSEGVAGELCDNTILFDNGASYAAADAVCHALDTTQDLIFKMTMQWDNAKVGNTATLQQGYIVSINPPRS